MMNDVPRITYLGQSGFYIETNDCSLLIDPTNKKSGDVVGDLVYCTHNHSDHTGGVETFLEHNEDAILVGNEQVMSSFPQYAERAKTVSESEIFDFKSISMTFTKLRHGLFKGVYNLAVEVHIGEFSFAHCGDAVSFEEFPSSPANILAIPISGAFAAGPKKVIEVIRNLPNPLPTVIPMHWLIRNPKSFCKKLRKELPQVNCIVPVTGEKIKGFE
jgi:L-ascorbate metabolism protein UlaG (beta-lactamase superfamily)